MSKRLFIALELPESCRETLAGLDPGLKGARWLRAEQMHLTLSFLGEVEAGEEEPLHQALGGVEVPAFFLPIRGVGTFGGARPTVVWAGGGSGHPHLFALRKRIQDALLQAGLEPDLSPFHPHITLARTKGVAREVIQPFLRQYADEEFGIWKVTGFALFSSALTAEGATYSIEMRREF